MAVLYIEGLSNKYKEKIKKRELSQEAIDSIFHSIKDDYHKRKRPMMLVSIMIIAMYLIMDVMVAYNGLKTNELSMDFILKVLVLFPIVVVIFILAVCHFLLLTRIPRQFSECLKIGYPELVDQYGYDAIKAPQLKTNDRK